MERISPVLSGTNTPRSRRRPYGKLLLGLYALDSESEDESVTVDLGLDQLED